MFFFYISKAKLTFVKVNDVIFLKKKTLIRFCLDILQFKEFDNDFFTEIHSTKLNFMFNSIFTINDNFTIYFIVETFKIFRILKDEFII